MSGRILWCISPRLCSRGVSEDNNAKRKLRQNRCIKGTSITNWRKTDYTQTGTLVVILARLITNVQHALDSTLPLGNPTCWTDSMVALYWVRNEQREWKQFVQNRVNEIRSLVPPECWRHCPGTCNPADIPSPSRGISPSQLNSYSLWFNGPEWLMQSNKREEPTEDLIPDECIEEMEKESRTKFMSSVTSVLADANTKGNLKKIVELSRFSDIQRLLRVTATIVQAVKILKYRIAKQGKRPPVQVSSEDLRETKTIWIKTMQANFHPNSRFASWENQFGLSHNDQGVLRCKGRIVKSRYSRGHEAPDPVECQTFLDRDDREEVPPTSESWRS